MSDIEFERRLETALRTPVPTSARAKQAIMEGVRRAARESRPQRGLIPGGRAARHSLIGLAMAAGIGSITTLSALAPRTPAAVAPSQVSSTVIGDSVVDRVRDTLRLVRLIFDAPAATRQVAVVGDFNGWRDDATRMQKDERTGRWSVTVALADGDHRYAIVTDNTRWNGRLHVAKAVN